jgi:hypothetical protein
MEMEPSQKYCRAVAPFAHQLVANSRVFAKRHAKRHAVVCRLEGIRQSNPSSSALVDTVKRPPAAGPKWLAKVHAIELGQITSTKIQEWKQSFLAIAGSDPLALRKARISINTFLTTL